MEFMDQDFFGVSGEQLLLAGAQTVYMLGWSMLFGAVLGIAIALLLVMTRRGGLTENRVVYGVLNFIINVTRSVPFIILLVALIPFTRFVFFTSIGSQAALVPPTIHITPFIARMVAASLLQAQA